MERDGEDKMKAVLQLPIGFRFHPTDEELVTRYLCRKCSSRPIPVPVIAEVDLYKYNPWQLPEMALYGEEEWYFFSPRYRKYPKCCRPSRTAGIGFWKATGRNKAIGPVGRKTILVFYSGKLPKAEKTNWVMHEYSLVNVETSNRYQNNSMLDDWVLCRIHKKTGAVNNKRKTTSSGLLRESGAQPQASWASPAKVNERVYLGPSGSVPKLLADSSYSEQVVLPEFKEKESYLDRKGDIIVGYPFNYMGATELTEREESLMWLDNDYKTWMI